MEENKTYQKPYKLDQNVEGALAYLVPPLTGIFIYMMEKQNKFVRFHALQSVLFGIAIVVLSTLLNMIFVGVLLGPLVGLGFFALWLYLMYSAYNNQEYELPFLGKIAKDQVNKA